MSTTTSLQHAVTKTHSSHELLRKAIREGTQEWFGLEVLEQKLLAQLMELRDYRTTQRGIAAAHSPHRVLQRASPLK